MGTISEIILAILQLLLLVGLFSFIHFLTDKKE